MTYRLEWCGCIRDSGCIRAAAPMCRIMAAHAAREGDSTILRLRQVSIPRARSARWVRDIPAGTISVAADLAAATVGPALWFHRSRWSTRATGIDPLPMRRGAFRRLRLNRRQPRPLPPPNPGRTPDPSKSNFTWAYLSTAHVTGLVPLPGYHVTIVVQRTDGSYRTYDGGGSTTPPGIKDWSYEPPGNKFAIESPCSTPDEAIDALNQNFKKLTQVPYWPTGPNSNTYAHQLLTLSNFTVPEYLVYPSITPDGDPPDVFTPLDVGPRSTFGWNNNAYGGRNYDSYGQPRN